MSDDENKLKNRKSINYACYNVKTNEKCVYFVYTIFEMAKKKEQMKDNLSKSIDEVLKF